MLCRHVWFLCSPEGVLYGQPLQLSALLAHYPTGAPTAGLQQQQQGSHLSSLCLLLLGCRCWAVNVLQQRSATHMLPLTADKTALLLLLLVAGVSCVSL